MADQTWLGKADHYLEAAQILLERKHYDSSVSRAYYAVRYAAIHLFIIRKLGWTPHWQHETIASKMIEQAHRLHWLRAARMAGQPDFGKSWLMLLKLRNEADYELSRMPTRSAERCLEFAQSVARIIKENSL
jgi:uncharacterized protein (UPF0332 family)